MNILIIQEYGRHKENQQFRECLSLQRSLRELAHNVYVWGLGHEDFNIEPLFNSYDIIINLENYDETGWVPDLSKFKRPYKILWSIDAHVRGMDSYLKTFNEGQYDLILQATKDYVDENSVWFPNCYDHTLFYSGVVKETFLGFCGSLLNRKGILDNLTEKYGLKQDIFVIGNSMVRAVGSYWIHFNCNIGRDINYRSFETLACGTVLLTNRNEQYGQLGFEDEVNCLMYADIEELYYKIEKYKDKEDELESIIERGFDLATKHTYDVRAKQLLKTYEDKK